MARLIFAPQAIDDVGGILKTLAEHAGRPVADGYAEQFRLAFERLTVHPRSGGPRPRFGRNVRVTVVRPYIVIYRAQADDLVILRVMHGRRNITRRTVTERTGPS